HHAQRQSVALSGAARRGGLARRLRRAIRPNLPPRRRVQSRMTRLACVPAFLLLFLAPGEETPLTRSIRLAEASLKNKDYDQAKQQIDRALERDPKLP